jgi:hypothetical protein
VIWFFPLDRSLIRRGNDRTLDYTFFASSLVLCAQQALAAEGAVRLECAANDHTCVDVVFDDARKSEQSGEGRSCKPGECVTTLASYPPCGRHHNSPFWTSIDAMHAQSEFDMMLKRAKSGELLDSRLKIVELIESRKDERHFALCTVRLIRGHEGLPTNCETMAIVTPGKTLIRGAFQQWMCPLSAFVGLDGASIDIKFKVITDFDGTRLASSLSKMLTDDLDMQFEQNVNRDGDGKLSSSSFSAIAPIRDSKFLSGGLRESFDLSISLYRDDKGYSVYGHTKPMICRTASGNVTEYHGLTDAQKSTYATALNSDISAAIARACPNFSEIDGGTLSCK